MKKTIYMEKEIIRTMGFKGWLTYIGEQGIREVFEICKKEIEISRTHKIIFDGKKMERQDNTIFLKSIEENPVFYKDSKSVEYIYCLFLLQTATIGVEQLNDEMTKIYVEKIIEEKCEFLKECGSDIASIVLKKYKDGTISIFDVASMIDFMRKEVTEKGYIYAKINGKSRIKKDFFIAKEEISSEIDGLANNIFNISNFRGDWSKVLNDNTLEETVNSIMKYCVEDERLGTHYIVFVYPKGTGLTHPEKMIATEDSTSDFGCRVIASTVAKKQLPMPQELLDCMVNKGMMGTKAKAVRTMFNEGEFTGEYTEKSQDLLILVNADEHIEAHKTIGMKSAVRAGISIYLREEGILLPPSYCDIRGIKLYKEFNESNLKRLLLYSFLIQSLMTYVFDKNMILK